MVSIGSILSKSYQFVTNYLGNPAVKAIAMWMLKSKHALTNAQLAKVVEVSLMSGGAIILIAAAGGGFGAMLKATIILI